MKKLNIFRAGKHISAAGLALAFSEADLKATVAAYNPAVHEAPIVVGHPADNGPAYGWVAGLSYSEETGLEAQPSQVDATFSEMVTAGRFKKISASFYTPDAPNNPSPGVYYLRHVGFLGAMPPAVKGLRDASFSDKEEGVVDFSDWDDIQNASLWRKMREWIIGKYDIAEADSVLPEYIISDLEQSARKETPDEATASPVSGTNFNEETKDIIVQKENERLKAEVEIMKAEQANFAEREASLKVMEKKAARATNEAFVESLVIAGKVLAAQKAKLADFMETLSEGTIIDFKEGDKVVAKTQVAAFKELLESQPKRVDFKEYAGGEEITDPNTMNPEELSEKAVEFKESEMTKGREITISQAVNHILKG